MTKDTIAYLLSGDAILEKSFDSKICVQLTKMFAQRQPLFLLG